MEKTATAALQLLISLVILSVGAFLCFITAKVGVHLPCKWHRLKGEEEAFRRSVKRKVCSDAEEEEEEEKGGEGEGEGEGDAGGRGRGRGLWLTRAQEALYIELEKERNAAAIAAEEAMSMISRLQKEKASVEMEARQYRRMAEQRQLHDHQAITLLKDIVVKLEKDKFSLQNQVDYLTQTQNLLLLQSLEKDQSLEGNYPHKNPLGLQPLPLEEMSASDSEDYQPWLLTDCPRLS